MTSSEPLILTEGKYTAEDVHQIQSNYTVNRYLDLIEDQLQELFEVRSPKNHSRPIKELTAQYLKERGVADIQLLGDWIYFPWNGNLVHMVTEADYYLLRTNRNQLLINPDEQRVLAGSCVAFAGLSIGSHFVSGLLYSGIAEVIKLADPDYLSTSNLNRVHATLLNVAQPKIDVVAQHGYEVNPYQQFKLYPEGINDQNMAQFLLGERKPQLIFEAVDDFRLKINLRLKAREQGIPVIMLTNLGDTLLIDIERYDLNPKLPLFNGLIGDTPEQILNNPISEKDKVQYAIDIITLENTPTRALMTLQEIGETLVGRPQLYSTVAISGGMAAYLTRRILLGKSLPSGRIKISLKDISSFDDDTDDGDRRIVIQQLNRKLGRG